MSRPVSLSFSCVSRVQRPACQEQSSRPWTRWSVAGTSHSLASDPRSASWCPPQPWRARWWVSFARPRSARWAGPPGLISPREAARRLICRPGTRLGSDGWTPKSTLSQRKVKQKQARGGWMILYLNSLDLAFDVGCVGGCRHVCQALLSLVERVHRLMLTSWWDLGSSTVRSVELGLIVHWFTVHWFICITSAHDYSLNVIRIYAMLNAYLYSPTSDSLWRPSF